MGFDPGGEVRPVTGVCPQRGRGPGGLRIGPGSTDQVGGDGDGGGDRDERLTFDNLTLS